LQASALIFLFKSTRCVKSPLVDLKPGSLQACLNGFQNRTTISEC